MKNKIEELKKKQNRIARQLEKLDKDNLYDKHCIKIKKLEIELENLNYELNEMLWGN